MASRRRRPWNTFRTCLPRLRTTSAIATWRASTLQQSPTASDHRTGLDQHGPEECNKLFAHKGADGITVGGNDFLLGSAREQKIIDGVRYVKISQVAKIDEMCNLYKDKQSECRAPKQPYPSNDDHPNLNDQLQAEAVDDSEWRDVIENED